MALFKCIKVSFHEYRSYLFVTFHVCRFLFVPECDHSNSRIALEKKTPERGNVRKNWRDFVYLVVSEVEVADTRARFHLGECCTGRNSQKSGLLPFHTVDLAVSSLSRIFTCNKHLHARIANAVLRQVQKRQTRETHALDVLTPQKIPRQRQIE